MNPARVFLIRTSFVDLRVYLRALRVKRVFSFSNGKFGMQQILRHSVFPSVHVTPQLTPLLSQTYRFE
jgi:hypothetical protein